MRKQITYKYEIVDSNGCKIAVVAMNKEALGGNDALEFTSTLQTIAAENPCCVIINMQELQIINSSGLGMLVSSLGTLKQKGIKLSLTAVPEKVTKLLEMTHLNKVFAIYETLDEALNLCKN